MTPPPTAAKEKLDIAIHEGRRTTSYPLAGFAPVFGWGLRQTLRRRRIFLFLAIAVALGAASALLVREVPGARDDPPFQLWQLLDEQHLLLLVPLIALLGVGPMFSRELRQRTFVYHLVRPVARSTVFLARFAAGVVPSTAVAVVLFFSTLFFAGVPLPPEVWGATAITAFAGVTVLGAVYYVLSAVFQRGLIAGLVYTFVVEGIVGNLPGTIQKLSVRFHLRSLHHGMTDAAFAQQSADVRGALEPGGPFSFLRIPFDEPGQAAVTLAGITLALLAFGVHRVTRRDFALKD